MADASLEGWKTYDDLAPEGTSILWEQFDIPMRNLSSTCTK
jgi:hypothetical protein